MELFTKLVSESLDELAPLTTFTVKSKHIFGLSDETKSLMRQRDEARKKASAETANQKVIWLNKYRSLRNKVIKAFLRLSNLKVYFS